MERFACIEMDPPWMERGGGKVKRGADRHYPVMTRQDIAATVLRSPVWAPANDAHLWCWATSNHLEDALWLIDALGFRYVTHAVWVKLRDGAHVDIEVRKAVTSGRPLAEVVQIGLATGLGQYLRGQHELLLLATRGAGAQVRTGRRDIPSVIVAPRGKHSEKPDAAYAMIEDRSAGPRLSMFSRSPRARWETWGPVLGHKVVVRELGNVRAGFQTIEDAINWCHRQGVVVSDDANGVRLLKEWEVEDITDTVDESDDEALA